MGNNSQRSPETQLKLVFLLHLQQGAVISPIWLATKELKTTLHWINHRKVRFKHYFLCVFSSTFHLQEERLQIRELTEWFPKDICRFSIFYTVCFYHYLYFCSGSFNQNRQTKQKSILDATRLMQSSEMINGHFNKMAQRKWTAGRWDIMFSLFWSEMGKVLRHLYTRLHYTFNLYNLKHLRRFWLTPVFSLWVASASLI